MPFGGGPGMVMKPEPIARAVEAIAAERGHGVGGGADDAAGPPFTQAEAERLSRLERLVVICGRYEGVDERVTEALVTDELSIGDYVLTGGELPALVVIDAVVRLVPGVVGDAASVAEDSFVRRIARLSALHAARGVAGSRRCRTCCSRGITRRSSAGGASNGVRRTLARRPDLIDAPR